jgi:pimeloyl-ACP methyl ester carboxylesterase
VTTTRLHDGSGIEIEVRGAGPNLLVAVNPTPVEGPQAEELRRWGADPALGRSLIDGLADVARVVAFDYEGHVLSRPMPDTLTPANIVADILTVADAAGADRFAFYGYSWLGMLGLQLVLSTDRVRGLAMGGFPPIDGPYVEMLRVTRTGYELAIGARTSGGEDEWASARLEPEQQRQFVTLYLSLQGFDDRAALTRIPRDVERLCFVGAHDDIRYGPTWGDVLVSFSGPVARGRTQLEALGWEVHILDGLDHTGAMQAATVLPLLRTWIGRIAAGRGSDNP